MPNVIKSCNRRRFIIGIIVYNICIQTNIMQLFFNSVKMYLNILLYIKKQILSIYKTNIFSGYVDVMKQ